MRETLEARLAGVAELRKVAEDEKLEKEESARKALAEQEAIMEKVVEESKTLQQAAEENSKVTTFSSSHGLDSNVKKWIRQLILLMLLDCSCGSF